MPRFGETEDAEMRADAEVGEVTAAMNTTAEQHRQTERAFGPAQTPRKSVDTGQAYFIEK
jgi:hypothetical protein